MLKKIIEEAMSLRWQSSTMCSSSLSSCCTSWTWCSFQPCPVGNQPVFSLPVYTCVCVCDAVMLCCPEPSVAQTRCPMGPPVWIGQGEAVWPARMNATQKATNATPKACLLDRGGHFLLSCSIFPPTSLFLLSKRASVGLKEACFSFSFVHKFSHSPVSWYIRTVLLFSFFFFFASILVTQSSFTSTSEKVETCHVVSQVCTIFVRTLTDIMQSQTPFYSNPDPNLNPLGALHPPFSSMNSLSSSARCVFKCSLRDCWFWIWTPWCNPSKMKTCNILNWKVAPNQQLACQIADILLTVASLPRLEFLILVVLSSSWMCQHCFIAVREMS